MGRIGDYEQSHGTPDQRYAAYERDFRTLTLNFVSDSAEGESQS